jgi:hypothetical protein
MDGLENILTAGGDHTHGIRGGEFPADHSCHENCPCHTGQSPVDDFYENITTVALLHPPPPPPTIIETVRVRGALVINYIDNKRHMFSRRFTFGR